MIAHPCGHCGAPVAAHMRRRHDAICPHNPAARAKIMTVLEDPAAPGCAVGVQAYKVASKANGAPSSTVLYRYFGAWPLVCAEFGLLSPNGENVESYAPLPADCDGLHCPHCGDAYPQHLWRHVRHCPRNPALRAAIIFALTDPDKPGQAVSRDEYSRRAIGTGAPDVSAVRRMATTWRDVCAYFGLEPPRRKSREEVVIAAIEEEIAEARSVLAYEKDRGGALEAFDWHYENGRRVEGRLPAGGGRVWSVLR